jgi:hypothetical protein
MIVALLDACLDPNPDMRLTASALVDFIDD